MKNADHLADFVQKSLAAGRPRADIRAALSEAGWTDTEIATGLNAWADTNFTPPVPRPRPFVSAREAFIYGLMFVALAMTAWHLTQLSFEIINNLLPDPNDARHNYRWNQTRWSISALIVFTPLFLFLNARANRAMATDPGRRRSTVRKWFGYITLFLAIIALLGDLLYLIYALLNGDLTLRFFCKTAVVGAVAGIVLMYFRADLQEDSDVA